MGGHVVQGLYGELEEALCGPVPLGTFQKLLQGVPGKVPEDTEVGLQWESLRLRISGRVKPPPFQGLPLNPEEGLGIPPLPGHAGNVAP